MVAPTIYISLLCGVAVLVLCDSAELYVPQGLAGDFDSQLQHILEEQLILSPQDPVITRALADVRATLDQRWTGYELIVYGSLGAGLGTRGSDLDLAVRLPTFNASDGLYVLTELMKLIKNQPELYARPRIHDVTGHGPVFLPGYGLYMLIIFYLQQKNLVPSGYMIQVNSTAHCIEGWNVDFNELPYNTTNTESLHQLLGGFFKYYSEFNFEEYLVTPFTGRPTPRNASTDIFMCPKECTSYNNTKNCTMQHPNVDTCIYNFDSEISIQDIFRRDENVAIWMTHERVTKFKHLMKSTAAMFEDLPSGEILSALLGKAIR
ncbi:hypothetical protein PYW07_012488 [Mythimna separata]|uniref:Polymerase nucleotidyl transferase domain-containing protein n=1 Tax=Mythimna separata TaxID=271217 RepID=A0AAD7YNG7_MYTSE|nr:hypothetical protein PYW07_012488 [Mythimna separata]